MSAMSSGPNRPRPIRLPRSTSLLRRVRAWRPTRLLLVVALTGLLASCRIDVSVDVTMRDDGSGTVSVLAVADADVVAQAPSITTDLRFDDVRAAGWVVEGPSPTASGGLQVLLTHTFQTADEATALIAQVGGADGPFSGITLGRSAVKKTTTYTLNGQLVVPNGLDAFSDADLTAAVGATPYAAQLAGAGLQPADAVGITFSATLPGTIDNTTSTATEGLRWTVPLDGTSVDVATLSEKKDTRNAWASPLARGARIALFVWLGIAFCFIVYVMLARRRQRIENQPWYEPGT